MRTQVRDSADVARQVEIAAGTYDYSKEGKREVWVNWQGKPYQAFILESKGKRHYVTYKNWPSNYNEWINEEALLTEAQAKRMLSRKAKGSTASRESHQNKAYDQMERSRELGNTLNQETLQQRGDIERHYEDRRRFGY